MRPISSVSPTPELSSFAPCLIYPSKTWDDINKGLQQGQTFRAGAYDPTTKAGLTRASQGAGPRAVTVTTAYDTFKREGPGLLELRRKVGEKGMLPDSRFKDINALEQWWGKRTSDPDIAELQKKVQLMADMLQKNFGSTMGGEWAFDVAADIIDPRYSTEAFERIWVSHERTMKEHAQSFERYARGELPFGDGSEDALEDDLVTDEMDDWTEFYD